jgi:septal ring factor EnvC (AmiA/AmiB activator)
MDCGSLAVALRPIYRYIGAMTMHDHEHDHVDHVGRARRLLEQAEAALIDDEQCPDIDAAIAARDEARRLLEQAELVTAREQARRAREDREQAARDLARVRQEHADVDRQAQELAAEAQAITGSINALRDLLADLRRQEQNQQRAEQLAMRGMGDPHGPIKIGEAVAHHTREPLAALFAASVLALRAAGLTPQSAAAITAVQRARAGG